MSSFVQLVQACEGAWESIRKEYPYVPENVVVVVGSGGRRAKNLLGHFAPDRWNLGEETAHEILIVAEQLHRGASDVMCTLLHESVHAIAKSKDIKDVSGQRHNKRFKILCEEIGLEPPEKPHKTLGWSAATITPALEWVFEKDIKAIEEALNLVRLLPNEAEKVKTSWSAVCACDRKIRVGKKIYSDEGMDIEIACTICGTGFEVEAD